MGFIKGIINYATDPKKFFVIAIAALAVALWKREKIVSNAVGYGVVGALLRFYVLHCVGLPLGIAVLMAVHFWRVRKDGGISGPL